MAPTYLKAMLTKQVMEIVFRLHKLDVTAEPALEWGYTKEHPKTMPRRANILLWIPGTKLLDHFCPDLHSSELTCDLNQHLLDCIKKNSSSFSFSSVQLL